MSRLRRDIDDLDESLFAEDEARARREERAARLERAEQQGRERAAEDAAIAARADKFRAETNDRAIIAEYQRAGVEPLKVNAAGVPTCSLSLLLWMGWTIQDTPAGKKLIKPVYVAPKPRPPQECT